MDIGQVDLYRRYGDGGQGVPQSVTVMGQRAGVDDDARRAVVTVLYAINKFSLVIGLKEYGLHIKFLGGQGNPPVYFRQACRAVHRCFPDARKI
jgi:hypothetical protein